MATASVEFPPRATPLPVAIPLEIVSTGTRVITRAVVSLQSEFPQTFTNSLVVDDVEFDTEGPPPVCTSQANPVVSLVGPSCCESTQLSSFILEGNVVTDTPLVEASLTVSSGGNSYTSDLLTWGSLPLQGGKLGPVRAGPLFPGSNLVTLRAANCRGASQAFRTLIYNPIPADARFALDHIEVTQAIQNPSNFVPLIAGKRTIARVFLRLRNPPGGTIQKVSGTLFAVRPDGSRPGGPAVVSSLNAISVDASTSLLDRRGDAQGGSLNFELPPQWIGKGRVALQLTSLSIDGVPTAIPCDGCSNHDAFGRLRFVEFQEAPAARIVFFSVPYTTGGITFEPSSLDFDLLESWIRRAYPTPRLISTRSRLKAFRGIPGQDFSCSKVNSRLRALRLYCTSYCFDAVHRRIKYYGLVSDARGFLRGCAPIGGNVGSGPAGSSRYFWDTDGSYADWYGAHEVAHMYGRKHPGFCNESSDDGSFPHAGGAIGILEFGFDVGDPAASLPMRAYPPAIWRDVMTYCDNQWISDYTYKGLLAKLRDLGGGAGGGAPAAEAIFVQGELNLTRDTAELAPFTRLFGLELSELPAASPYAIRLQDAGGRALATYPFEPELDSDVEPGEDLLGSIDVVVPWVNETRRIAVLKNGIEIASRSASRSAPVVRLLDPTTAGIDLPRGFLRVSWEASDADGDPLSFSLLYSADGGRRWEPIDAGITGSSLDICIADLPGSEAALFRLIATDGFNTSSDDLDRPIRVPFKPPVARILSPASGSVFGTSSTIVLQGEAHDVEDGDLEGAALSWRSDSAGSLGTGGSAAATGLGPGLHRITLEATDSTGAQGADSVDIEVLASPPVAVIAGDTLVLAGGTVTLDGGQSMGLAPLEYSWRLVERPAGSAAAIGASTAPQASFVADRAGSYAVELDVGDGTGLAAVTRHAVAAVTAILFQRGEVNRDGRLDLGDAVRILAWLFQGTASIDCLDAADVNDDGRNDLTDAVYLLGYLFLGGPAPAPPFPACGIDPTPDALGCQRAACP